MLITGLIAAAPSALPLTSGFTIYYENRISSSIFSKKKKTKQEEKAIEIHAYVSGVKMEQRDESPGSPFLLLKCFKH